MHGHIVALPRAEVHRTLVEMRELGRVARLALFLVGLHRLLELPKFSKLRSFSERGVEKWNQTAWRTGKRSAVILVVVDVASGLALAVCVE